MVVDGWSLKDCEKIFPMDFISYSLIKHKSFFLPEDIVVLREKLIEDCEKAWKHVEGCSDKSNREYWFYTEWLQSIKNRFGVE